MTREDEILSAASDHRDWVCCGFIDFVADARRDSFAEGAKWADKTMIDKVCEWLEDYDITKHISVIYSGACSINFDKQTLIAEFCKAMQE